MIEIPDNPNPFTDVQIVGADIDGEVYRRQEPGVERGHADYVMSRSDLMAFRSCPAKWRAGWEPVDTEATDWGSLQDCRVLTPGAYLRRYVETPKVCKATKSMQAVKDGEVEPGADVPWNPLAKECRDWKHEQEAAGRIVLNATQKAESDEALAILAKDQRISDFLALCDRQVYVIGNYRDDRTGLVIPVKALIDLVPRNETPHAQDLGDFKTARSAHPKTWLKVIDERDYDAQAAMCLDLYTAATDKPRVNFVHVIQENTHPWQTARRVLSVEFIRLGRWKIQLALERYAKCLNEDVWPDWDEDSPFNGWTLCEPDQWHSMLR